MTEPIEMSAKAGEWSKFLKMIHCATVTADRSMERYRPMIEAYFDGRYPSLHTSDAAVIQAWEQMPAGATADQYIAATWAAIFTDEIEHKRERWRDWSPTIAELESWPGRPTAFPF